MLTALSIGKSHGGPWVILGDFNCTPGDLANSMGAALEAAGAVIASTKEPMHYLGGTAKPATLDFALVDARIANGRVVKSVEVDLDLAIGGHRAIRVQISNKGHICYVTKIIKPRAFPRKVPVGCPRKPVSASGSIEELGLDVFYQKTLACAEAETARLHDLVEVDGTMRAQFAGRDLGLRTRQCLLLPPRSRACLGMAGDVSYLAKWISERIRELKHHCAIHRQGLLTLAGLRQVEGIKGRFNSLAKDEKRMKVLLAADSNWAEWIVKICGTSTTHAVTLTPLRSALTSCRKSQHRTTSVPLESDGNSGSKINGPIGQQPSMPTPRGSNGSRRSSKETWLSWMPLHRQCLMLRS